MFFTLFKSRKLYIMSNNTTVVVDNVDDDNATLLIVSIVTFVIYFATEWIVDRRWHIQNLNIITAVYSLKNYIAKQCSCKKCKGTQCFRDCSRIVCLELPPPQLWNLKLWCYLFFTFAWSQHIYASLHNNREHNKDIATVVAAVITSVTITMGIILSTSLKKHQDSIRLYEVYTGDVIALGMEITAFVENSGYGGTTARTELAQNTVIWDTNDINNNNSKEASWSEKLERARRLVGILAILIKDNGRKYNNKFMTSPEVISLKDNKAVYAIVYSDRPNPAPAAFRTRIRNEFRTRVGNTDTWINDLLKEEMNGKTGYAPLKDALEHLLREQTQPVLLYERDAFLLAMERIFQTLYILPQVSKHEFRNSQFKFGKLDTMVVKYSQLCSNNKLVKFDQSKIYEPWSILMNQLIGKTVTKEDKSDKLHDLGGLSHTQVFLLTLLDYINELHRTTGAETQTRRTLTTAWRRLYGTYGSLSTVKTYKLPRIVSVTMEFALLGSSLVLPYSIVVLDIGAVLTPLVCVCIQFILAGLFISSQSVRNPFVKTSNALGFENVTSTALETQIGVTQLWRIRGIIQQSNPLSLEFDCTAPVSIKNDDDVDESRDVERGPEVVLESLRIRNIKF